MQIRVILLFKKAPASTIYDLALAIKELFNPKTEIKVIGTRHGEKAHEVLVGREEIVKAVDMGHFYRIPADGRDLNYDKYFVEGNTRIEKCEEYTSFNTQRLDKDGVIELLLKLDYIQEELKTKEYIGVAK